MAEKSVILVTGATDGLGRELAGRLVGEGASVILHGRSREKLDRTIAEISQLDRGWDPVSVIADLADLSQVRDLAHQVASVTDHLDVLVNNAGIGFGAPDGRDRRVSADGYELRFAVNYLAGFALTLRLLPLLRSSGAARIVNVASIGQEPIDFDDVMLVRDYDGGRAYRQSKLAQITAGFVLADRLAADRSGSGAITVNSLHPATYMPTKMVLQELGKSVEALEVGESATRRLVTDPGLATTTGRFFDHATEARANEAAYDEDVRSRLWELSLDLTGAPDPD